MAFLRRKTNKRADKAADDADTYEQATNSRLRSIGERGGYEFSPDERGDVEARIRNMWYGAKKEGSRAEREGDGDGEDDR